MITDERLEELKAEAEMTLKQNGDNDITVRIGKQGFDELIQEQEQQRRIPTEEVQNLIDLIDDNTIIACHSDEEGTELDTGEISLLITALRQMRPKDQEPCDCCFLGEGLQDKFCAYCGRPLGKDVEK